MVDCFMKSNTNRENAQAMADLLVEADYRGHFSHGMNRLEMYINDLHKNSTDGNATPEILNQTPATAWVDGLNGLGAVVGNFCMDLAVEKAKTTGVGVVCAKREDSRVFNFRQLLTGNFHFRLKPLRHRRLVHLACHGQRLHRNVSDQHFASDVPDEEHGSRLGHEPNFLRCSS